MVFHFKAEEGTQRNEIIFAKVDCIFKLNFHTQVVKKIHTFTEPLKATPQHFVCNEQQEQFLISNSINCLYLDINSFREVDIDKEYSMSQFKTIYFDSEDNQIYILSNKVDGQLGFFVLKISSNDPFKHSYLIKWKKKLDIGDVNIYILRNKERRYKEIVISYKTIYINVYNILVLDTYHKSNQPIMYRHESFQLWESQVQGCLISKNNNFVTLNRDGVNVFSLGSVNKKEIEDATGGKRMMHSFESVNYLKLDPTNAVVFAN